MSSGSGNPGFNNFLSSILLFHPSGTLRSSNLLTFLLQIAIISKKFCSASRDISSTRPSKPHNWVFKIPSTVFLMLKNSLMIFLAPSWCSCSLQWKYICLHSPRILQRVTIAGWFWGFFVCIFFRFSSALYIVFDYSKLLLLLFVLFLQVSLLHVSNFKI